VSVYSQAQLAQLAASAGPGDTATAAAIAMAESGGDSAAVGTNTDGSRDRGLWQINTRWHPEVSDACAFDPACNAQQARAISNGWSNFHPWSSFNSGAYLKFAGGSPASQTAPQGPDLAGQSVVGTMITSPWFPGSWEVTQGYGQTDYSGEPEGHGAAHWHAGVDIGLDSGTELHMPAGLSGRARAMDNPNGYGTALIVLLDNGPAVLLGHLRQRWVADGDQLRPGDLLAASDSTGNSTGPHLHFEVRPQDSKSPTGMGAYGTDLDPSALLTSGSSASLLGFGLPDPIGDLERTVSGGIQNAVLKALQAGQVAVGGGLALSGLLVAGYGLRGRSPALLRRDVGRLVRRPSQAPPRRRPQPAPSGAEATRLRPNLQPAPPPAGVPG
jgi:murein DD-endopeptidase MepM/ murein hydrolase activator NlpD